MGNRSNVFESQGALFCKGRTQETFPSAYRQMLSLIMFSRIYFAPTGNFLLVILHYLSDFPDCYFPPYPSI